MARLDLLQQRLLRDARHGPGRRGRTALHRRLRFLPLLRGEAAFDRGALFWHYPHYGGVGGTPGCSIRLGDYKLVEFFEDGRLELYNLREDLGETRNLAADLPAVARDLHERLVAWRESVEALLPTPNPDWKE